VIAWLLWAGAAQAQDPPVSEEIIVVGDLAIRQARDRLRRQMEALGWRPVDRPGRTVFRGPAAWMGVAIVDDFGGMRFRAPLIGVARELPPEMYTTDPFTVTTDPSEIQNEVGIGVPLQLRASPRKLAAVRQGVAGAVEDELDAYRDVIQRTSLQEQLLWLPDALDALWEKGTPLTGSTDALAGADARRKAALTFWAERADSDEGRQVCAAVEAWLRAVVQDSDAPITDAERVAFEALRTDGRILP